MIIKMTSKTAEVQVCASVVLLVEDHKYAQICGMDERKVQK